MISIITWQFTYLMSWNTADIILSFLACWSKYVYWPRITNKWIEEIKKYNYVLVVCLKIVAK